MAHVHAESEYSQITEQIYIGTNLCCTTSPHVEVLRKEGINAEIDLEEERQEPPPMMDVYLWLPVTDHAAPKQDQLDAGVGLLESLVTSGRKVYVHCKLGHGRSPTLVAAYFIFHGVGVDAAIEKIKDKRPEIHLEDVQMECLISYKDRLRSIS